MHYDTPKRWDPSAGNHTLEDQNLKIYPFENLKIIMSHIIIIIITTTIIRLATSWTVRGSNPGGCEIFHTRPDRPWVPPSLLCNGHQWIC
jgi:hypothetical protein